MLHKRYDYGSEATQWLSCFRLYVHNRKFQTLLFDSYNTIRNIFESDESLIHIISMTQIF